MNLLPQGTGGMAHASKHLHVLKVLGEGLSFGSGKVVVVVVVAVVVIVLPRKRTSNMRLQERSSVCSAGSKNPSKTHKTTKGTGALHRRSSATTISAKIEMLSVYKYHMGMFNKHPS